MNSNSSLEDRPKTIIARSLPGRPPVRVAYLMSRFPKITETFILYEMLAVAEQGVEVELYPLWREHTRQVHPEAQPLVARAQFEPSLAWRFLKSHAYFLRRNPLSYCKTLGALLRGTWRSPRYLLGALAIFPKVVHWAYLMRRANISHIHAHFASHPAAAAFAIGRLTGIPYSFTAHGSDLHRDKTMLRAKVREASWVVAISQYNRDLILDECPTEDAHKVEVIHCGVNLSAIAVRDNQQRISRDPFNIICIGTLHEVKGQAYLIDACQSLRRRGVKVSCHFVGDGPDEAALRRRARASGIENYIHFHGRCTRGRVLELLAQSHVLAAPSVFSRDGRREGIPVVLMEAMAVGVPVVASQISGIPELIDDGVSGLLVPPRDHRLLAEAIERMYRDPALSQQLATAARQKVKAEFNLHRSAERLAQRFCVTVSP